MRAIEVIKPFYPRHYKTLNFSETLKFKIQTGIDSY